MTSFRPRPFCKGRYGKAAAWKWPSRFAPSGRSSASKGDPGRAATPTTSGGGGREDRFVGKGQPVPDLREIETLLIGVLAVGERPQRGSPTRPSVSVNATTATAEADVSSSAFSASLPASPTLRASFFASKRASRDKPPARAGREATGLPAQSLPR